ncbi:hypothetical protein ACHAWF_003384 [Thalassiosira exigua]
MKVGEPLLYITTEGEAASGATGGGGVAGGGAEEPSDQVPPKATTLHSVDDEEDRLHIPAATTSVSYDQTTGSTTKVLTSPAVRKLGREHGIDLSTVAGTGPRGRVLKADVLKLLGAKEGRSASPPPPPTQMGSAQTTTPPAAATKAASTEEDTVIPIRGYHRRMVKSMASSLQVPHMTYTDDVNVDALTSVRDSLRPMAKKLGVEKLTYLPFFVKAASLAMNEYPAVNSSIDVENMTLTHRKEHNVGVAVDTPRGLAVPVVRGCQDRSVLEIAAELARLFALASEGNLSEADILDPTFTLSNIGAIGGTYMSPVVLPPQVAIGAMGKIQRLPRFVSDDSDEVVAARIMPISWGGDHRAIDGATMARFGNLWKSYVENPASMVFAMR